MRQKEVPEIKCSPLKHEVHLNNKNSVLTSKETTNRLHDNDHLVTLFKEIIAVYSEKHTKPTNILCEHKYKSIDC
jgi:hypothetical protein